MGELKEWSPGMRRISKATFGVWIAATAIGTFVLLGGIVALLVAFR